ncbi:MAG: ParB/RepB/Spo0J family partition protein [Streptosporangiaceae bacterium]
MSDLTDVPAGIPDDNQTDLGPDKTESAEPAGGGGQPDPNSVAARPVIAVTLLTAHPGNVRRDLDLTAEFVASVAANGVLVPLRITPDPGGAYRVIDGHRRLAAALRAGLTEVPVDVAGERAGDEPGQFLDMWTAHRHTRPLAPVEEADALFAAREAGATRARIRKATGLRAAGVSAALAAAGLTEQTRSVLDGLDRQLSLDQLAVIAEFEDDARAVARLMAAARGGGFDHEAERLRQQRAEQAAHRGLAAELEAAGFAVTDGLPPGAQLLTVLAHGGADLTSEAHAECPGRGVYFRSWDLASPVQYCADPAAHGHAPRYGPPAGLDLGGAADRGGAVGRAGSPEGGAADPGRRLVVAGNRAWKAASEVRGRWLAGSLFARRTAPREAAQFTARQLLMMPEPLRSGLAAAPGRELLTQITGQSASRLAEGCDTAKTGRLPLLMLAPVVTAYEHAMTEGEGRNVWRTDRYAPCPRAEAGGYLAFLASLGYELSGIEQAIVDGIPWTDAPPGDPLVTGADPETDQADADDTSDAGHGVPDSPGSDVVADNDAGQAAA